MTAQTDSLMTALISYIDTKISHEFGVGSDRNTAEVRNKLVEELTALIRLTEHAVAAANQASAMAGRAMLPHLPIGPGPDWYGQGQTGVIQGLSWNSPELQEPPKV